MVYRRIATSKSGRHSENHWYEMAGCGSCGSTSRSCRGSSRPIVMLADNCAVSLSLNVHVIEAWLAQCDNSLPLNDACLFPRLLPRILQGSVRWLGSLSIQAVPLNFLRGIMDSSNFSSSLIITFLLDPSPMTRRVLPHPKSSMHPKEYTGSKKL